MIVEGSFSFWKVRSTSGGTCPSCGIGSLTTEEALARVAGELSYVTVSSCGACAGPDPAAAPGAPS